MGVTVCLPLFGNPGQELEEGAAAKSQDLRRLGEALRERLAQAADMLDRLTAGGWSAQIAMYDLILSHPQVATREQAVQRLQSLGLDPEPFLIIEDVEEEEEPL